MFPISDEYMTNLSGDFRRFSAVHGDVPKSVPCGVCDILHNMEKSKLIG